MTNDEMRNASGSIDGNRLDCFFYMLLRDHMTAGQLEDLVMECEKVNSNGVNFTNGWLAEYAQNIKLRLDK